MTELAATDVNVSIRKRALVDGVSFQAPAGQLTAIVGPNGAGKSTLLRALAGVAEHGGTIMVDQQVLGEMTRAERAATVAYLPQIPTVPDDLHVREFVELGRLARYGYLGRPSDTDTQTIEHALASLSLQTLAHRKMGSLSGGERQRALLAQVLAQDTPILLLDEPTTSLDIGHQQELMHLIDELRHSRQLTVIATLHDLTQAAQYANNVLLMNQGAVVASGSPHDVLTASNIEQHFGARVRIHVDDAGQRIIVPLRFSHARESEAVDNDRPPPTKLAP